MSNTVPGSLEMIDGPCKYAHYHICNPHIYPHHSLSTVGHSVPLILCSLAYAHVVRCESAGIHIPFHES